MIHSYLWIIMVSVLPENDLFQQMLKSHLFITQTKGKEYIFVSVSIEYV